MHNIAGKRFRTALLGLPLAAPALAAEPPGSIRHFRSDTVVEADGQAVQTAQIEIAVNNDAAARRAIAYGS